jgi:hypothetical protein
MVSIFCTAAGRKEKKPDTCSIPSKTKVEVTKKKTQKSRKPLYEMIFMI